jgi:polysaccharide pyruvyl transferase WcaK-like protein
VRKGRVTSGRRLRVGFFGLLGDGSIGNDASMESVLLHLRKRFPDARITAMCTGPDRLSATYGIDAKPLCWGQNVRPANGFKGMVFKIAGKGFDALRVPLWVRGNDVVIVPGMGVLEATLPLRPWEMPYMLLLLCASGRLFRTRVALVSVGANMMRQRVTRRLLVTAARCAFYRSYRDEMSRNAIHEGGVDTANDPVYPDLVYGLPAPPDIPAEHNVVGVGVMGFYGNNDDRQRAEAVHRRYVATMERFVHWLVDDGREVRLLVGDKADHEVVNEILSRVTNSCFDAGSKVQAQTITSFAELSAAMGGAQAIVATRFHNVVCALKLSKPTISLGYAAKNVALMEEAGLGAYCQAADSIDFDVLVKQLEDLESHSDQLIPAIAERSNANAALVQRQFEELDALLFTDA